MFWIRIGIQSGSRILMTKNGNKFTAKTKIYLFFGWKTTIDLSLGLNKERSSYRRSLQPQKRTPNFKPWNFLSFPYFYGSFLPLPSLHRPDWIWIQYGSGSETLVILYYLSPVRTSWGRCSCQRSSCLARRSSPRTPRPSPGPQPPASREPRSPTDTFPTFLIQGGYISEGFNYKVLIIIKE